MTKDQQRYQREPNPADETSAWKTRDGAIKTQIDSMARKYAANHK